MLMEQKLLMLNIVDLGESHPPGDDGVADLMLDKLMKLEFQVANGLTVGRGRPGDLLGLYELRQDTRDLGIDLELVDLHVVELRVRLLELCQTDQVLGVSQRPAECLPGSLAANPLKSLGELGIHLVGDLQAPVGHLLAQCPGGARQARALGRRALGGRFRDGTALGTRKRGRQDHDIAVTERTGLETLAR